MENARWLRHKAQCSHLCQRDPHMASRCHEAKLSQSHQKLQIHELKCQIKLSISKSSRKHPLDSIERCLNDSLVKPHLNDRSTFNLLL